MQSTPIAALTTPCLEWWKRSTNC